jgi:hypothetical protein
METSSFERRRLRVYVAGPISSNVFEGVARGSAAGRKLFLDGLAPFVPHFDAYWWLPEGNWNAYLEYDLEYISVVDAVYRLDGDSKGADLECRVARELGIPIFYENVLDAPPGNWGYRALLDYAELKGLRGKRQVVDRPQEVPV